jgi:uncharacterized repeat protein (TIGR02543 family)
VIQNYSVYQKDIEADEHNYTVKAVSNDGVDLGKEYTGVAKEQATYTIAGLPEVIEKDGVFYQLDSSVENHTVTFTMGTEDANESVTYEKNDNIVYFAEAEDYSSAAAVSEDSTKSGGKVGASAATNNISYLSRTALGTLPVGEYKFTIDLIANPERGAYLRKTDDNTAVVNQSIVRGSAAGIYSVNFKLVEDTALSFTGFTTANSTVKANQSATVDYVLVEYVGSVVVDTVTVNDDGNETSVKVADGESYTLPEAAGKDGFTFEGWTTDGEDAVAAGTVVTVNGDVTYTAKYTSNVTYKADEGYTFGGETSPVTLADVTDKYIKITATKGSVTKSSTPVAVASLNITKPDGVTEDSNVKFGLIITNIEDGVTIDKVELVDSAE